MAEQNIGKEFAPNNIRSLQIQANDCQLDNSFLFLMSVIYFLLLDNDSCTEGITILGRIDNRKMDYFMPRGYQRLLFRIN